MTMKMCLADESFAMDDPLSPVSKLHETAMQENRQNLNAASAPQAKNRLLAPSTFHLNNFCEDLEDLSWHSIENP
jgi:hypothetical protein